MVGRGNDNPVQGRQIPRTPVHSLRSGLQYQRVSLNFNNQRSAVVEDSSESNPHSNLLSQLARPLDNNVENSSENNLPSNDNNLQNNIPNESLLDLPNEELPIDNNNLRK